MNYNLKSKMAMNVMQTKKRSGGGGGSSGSSRAERSQMQSKQMYMD